MERDDERFWFDGGARRCGGGVLRYVVIAIVVDWGWASFSFVWSWVEAGLGGVFGQ